jgi:hypothetical protein
MVHEMMRKPHKFPYLILDVPILTEDFEHLINASHVDWKHPQRGDGVLGASMGEDYVIILDFL